MGLTQRPTQLHQRFVYEGDYKVFVPWAQCVLEGIIDGTFVTEFRPKIKVYNPAGEKAEEDGNGDEDDDERPRSTRKDERVRPRAKMPPGRMSLVMSSLY